MKFTNNERMLMILYNPGSRTGLAEELTKMQRTLTKEDRDLKKMIDGLVPKLHQISDAEFDQILDACL